eukprot:2957677-Pyramimonas_sp.AAC.1
MGALVAERLQRDLDVSGVAERRARYAAFRALPPPPLREKGMRGQRWRGAEGEGMRGQGGRGPKGREERAGNETEGGWERARREGRGEGREEREGEERARR